MAQFHTADGKAPEAKPKMRYRFIGSAWKRTSKDKGDFLSVRIDKRLPQSKITLESTDAIQIWPNPNKKVGSKQPDFRISVLVPQE